MLNKKEVRACWNAHPQAEGPWRGKRTLLLEEMAVSAGVPNAKLIGEYLRGGVPILGEVVASGLFAEDEHQATKGFEEVLQTGKWSKPVIEATTRQHSDPSVDDEVWKRTEEEVEEGKARGPFGREEVDAILGKHWAPVRRVGLSRRPASDR